MHQREPAPYTWLTQLVHQVARRWHRGFTFLGIAFVITTTAFWALGGPAWEKAGAYTKGRFATSHERYGSDWRTPNDPSLIPPKIWQILLSKKNTAKDSVGDPENLKDTLSWVTKNTDYAYTLVGDRGAQEFVQSRFANEPGVLEAYNSLPSVGMKSDLLRYLILHSEGGVYTDTDTSALKPIDAWVPPDMRDKVRLIVGIEFDRRDGGGWAEIPHWLQFCQWTIAAAPGHPVFEKMVARVMQSVGELSATHKVPVDKLSPTSFEVMNSTGPAAWTDVVFERLQEHDPSLKSTADLSFMTEPKLYGDILVLTIDGFGMGQRHSHSTNNGSIPDSALVRHHFRGSWRHED